MQNLPHTVSQRDKALYQSITPQGSQNYENLYMSGKAKRENAKGYAGIPVDDFHIFATAVYSLADHRKSFDTIHNSGNPVRHIDIGTGPNLYMFIASLPYADELIAVDITPANIERLQAVAKETTKIAPHWQAWLEIASILYDIGTAKALIHLSRNHSDLYDQLRHWPTLEKKKKQDIKKEIYDKTNIKKQPSNPYNHIDLQAEFTRKLMPRVGDVIDDVASVSDLIESADIYTRVFFSESIDSSLAVVAHAETNSVQLAKEGALSISGHMSKTTGYKGFFTPQELKEDTTKKLAELPATSGFFEEMIGKLVTLSDKYRMLWEYLGEEPEDRKMVRQGIPYGGAVILCGTTCYKKLDGTNKYKDGLELLQSVDTLRTVTLPQDDMIVYCSSSEIGTVVHELTSPFFQAGRSAISLSVANPFNIE